MAPGTKGADGRMKIAAFTGKIKDFRLYLLAMRTWAEWQGEKKKKEGAA